VLPVNQTVCEAEFRLCTELTQGVSPGISLRDTRFSQAHEH